MHPAACPKPSIPAAPPARTKYENRIRSNALTARIIPLMLACIVGYATWVNIVTLCAHYLLHPPPELVDPRVGAGVTIIVLYFFLFTMMTWAYLRLLITLRNPGYTAKGTDNEGSHLESALPDSHTATHFCVPPPKARVLPASVVADKTAAVKIPGTGPLGEPTWALNVEAMDELGMMPGNYYHFTDRRVFQCDEQGLPRWCASCNNWKPDRAHHSNDVGKCVLKYDHFCPWVGGPVAERNFKFFIQFNCWGLCFNLFNAVVMAVFIADLEEERLPLNPNWPAVLGLSLLFALFSGGMAGTAINFALRATTTIDNITRATKVYHLAIYLPPPLEITKPTATIVYPLGASRGALVPDPAKEFAVLELPPGDNPWDLGPAANFRQVMGLRCWDWFLPLRSPPCADHYYSKPSFYELGPAVDRALEAAGLEAVKETLRTPVEV